MAATLTIVGVVAVGFIARESAAWTDSDMTFLRQVSLAHSPLGDWLSLTINDVFAPVPAALITLAGAAAVYAITRRSQPAIHFLVLVAVPWLGTEVIKLVVHRPRPDIASLAHPLILEPGGLS